MSPWAFSVVHKHAFRLVKSLLSYLLFVLWYTSSTIQYVVSTLVRPTVTELCYWSALRIQLHFTFFSVICIINNIIIIRCFGVLAENSDCGILIYSLKFSGCFELTLIIMQALICLNLQCVLNCKIEHMYDHIQFQVSYHMDGHMYCIIYYRNLHMQLL